MYADIFSTIASSSHAPQLPPLQAATSPDLGYYPPRSATQQLNAVFGRDAVPAPNPQQQLPPQQRTQVPQFTKCTNISELRPHVNIQPPFRRANPEGGFISVCWTLALSTQNRILIIRSLFKPSQLTCRRRIVYVILLSNTSLPEILVESLPSRAKVARMMATTTKTAIISSMSMTSSGRRRLATSRMPLSFI